MKNLQKGSRNAILIIVLSVLVLFVVFYYLKKPAVSLLRSSGNFEYKSGLKFWTNSIDTKINTTFSEVAKEGIIKPCTVDLKNPVGVAEQINSECRKSPGRIAIVNQKQVFVMPEDQGYLTRNMRDSIAYPESFYSPDYQTFGEFIVIPFDDYYIPSYYDTPKDLLKSWKQEMMVKLNISDSDFTQKIRVIGISLGGNDKYTIHAYYVNDWVQVSFSNITNINWKQLVISKEKFQTIINGYKYRLEWDINDLFFDSENGDIAMRVNGVKDMKNNKCVQGVLDLSTGDMQIIESACVVY